MVTRVGQEVNVFLAWNIDKIWPAVSKNNRFEGGACATGYAAQNAVTYFFLWIY